MMNSVVEIHDSTLTSITSAGHELVLRLAPAYVHRSSGRPGIDHGTGWLQALDIIVSDAVVESSPSRFPCSLADGSISVDEGCWENVIPLPLAVVGAVSLTAVTEHGELLVVRGSGVSITTRGELRYVELFSGADDV